MNKIKISSLCLLLILTMSSNCFAKSDSQELKLYEETKVASARDKEKYKNSIENEIVKDGVKYQLRDTKEQENRILVTKEKEDTKRMIVYSNNKFDVLNMFETSIKICEDGFDGTLEIQNDSLDIQVNSSYTEEYKVEIIRNYDNVPSNELNNIPKTIIENSTTYYLTNPEWTVVNTETIDNQQVPVLYNGTMHYEGIKTRTIIQNYIATVNYKGTLEKEEVESITYTNIYEEIPVEKENPTAIIATSGFVIISGIFFIKCNNTRIYALFKGNYRLIKRMHINIKHPYIDITSEVKSNKYNIKLSSSIYKKLENKNVTIKYYDKQFNYLVQNKEFEINV